MITRRLQDRVWFVFPFDPALNTDDAGLEKAYQEHLEKGTPESCDALPTKQGMRVARFELMRLGRKAWKRALAVRERDGEGAFHDELVALSLRSAVNLTDEQGQPIALYTTTPPGQPERLRDDCLDAIYDPVLFRSLGTRIEVIRALDPTRG